MRERLICQKDTKIIYNYLKGKEKNPNDEEFNYPEDWPRNYEGDGGKLFNIKASTLFSLALAIGYKKGEKKSIDSTKELSNKKDIDYDVMTIIEAIAIYEESLDILKEDDLGEIYKNAEEYANGGIEFLNEEYQENMHGIINDWHLEIENIIKEKKILEKVKNL